MFRSRLLKQRPYDRIHHRCAAADNNNHRSGEQRSLQQAEAVKTLIMGPNSNGGTVWIKPTTVTFNADPVSV